jgi:hypothetical protein
MDSGMAAACKGKPAHAAVPGSNRSERFLTPRWGASRFGPGTQGGARDAGLPWAGMPRTVGAASSGPENVQTPVADVSRRKSWSLTEVCSTLEASTVSTFLFRIKRQERRRITPQPHRGCVLPATPLAQPRWGWNTQRRHARELVGKVERPLPHWLRCGERALHSSASTKRQRPAALQKLRHVVAPPRGWCANAPP